MKFNFEFLYSLGPTHARKIETEMISAAFNADVSAADCARDRKKRFGQHAARFPMIRNSNSRVPIKG